VKNLVDELAKEFSSESHGSSDLHEEQYFVRGASDEEFLPLSHLIKSSEIKGLKELKSNGYVASSLDYLDLPHFDKWWQQQFNRKILQKDRKTISIIHCPDNKKIFDAVEVVHEMYQVLKSHNVLMNGKNLPIQLGEWYAKTIFGLDQKKSSSQRGFDFYFEDKKCEVKVHWHDITSPKGVKLKKSLVEMSDYTIIMYVAKNFMIRDILFLDSDFIIRKFAGKGHTIFLKDSDVISYFFSKSNKHYGKIVNKPSLLKFSTPNLAMSIDEKSN
tara:strand:- start:40307 stop:41122 length:816 start_codon:yes stop_codon:yes gene_type:complete